MEIIKLFQMMVKYDSSDLHLKVDQPPVFRVHGQLTRMQNTAGLSPDALQALLYPIMSEDDKNELRERGKRRLCLVRTGTGSFSL